MKNFPLKIALIGTSCVGKTTLLVSLADVLRQELPGIKVETIEEAARIYFTHNKTEEPFLYFHQWQIQTLAKLQEQIAYFKNPHAILTDRSILDAVVYVKTMGDEKGAEKLLQQEKGWLSTYTHFFLLDPKGVPYKTDGVRKEAKNLRDTFHKTFVKLLSQLHLPHTIVSGSEQKRLETVFKFVLNNGL